MEKCAIYCRLSKEDTIKEKESESISNQKNLLIEYAELQNWQIYQIYSDEDYSGIDKNRPAFLELLQDAKAKRFSIILCKTQSRFTRDMELVEKYIHGIFMEQGIRFVSLLDHIDTQVKGNKKSRQINGLINEWYLEDLSDNIRAVLEQKRRSGQYIGSFALYGYKKNPHNKNKLEPDWEAATVVTEIFRLYLAGNSSKAIAKALERRQIPAPLAYKQSKGLGFSNGRTGGAWTSAAVGRILKNEIYTGTLVQGKHKKISYKTHKIAAVPKNLWAVVENTHTPIVTKETFWEVQKRLAQHQYGTGTGGSFALAGKVFCRDCGSSMSKYSRTYQGKTTYYLRCSRYARNVTAKSCTPHAIRLDTIEQQLDATKMLLCIEISEKNPITKAQEIYIKYAN